MKYSETIESQETTGCCYYCILTKNITNLLSPEAEILMIISNTCICSNNFYICHIAALNSSYLCYSWYVFTIFFIKALLANEELAFFNHYKVTIASLQLHKAFHYWPEFFFKSPQIWEADTKF